MKILICGINSSNRLDFRALKIQTKIPRVCNPKQCLQYTYSLLCDVNDFILDLKLFKSINSFYFDVAVYLKKYT